MSGLVVATLPLPPSANAMYRCVPAGRGRARTIKSKAGRDYEALCARLMDAHVERARGEVPGEGPLRADVTLYVPDRRKRDRDNMLKALMDVVSRNLGFDDARVWGGETRKRIDRRRPRAEVLIGREDV